MPKNNPLNTTSWGNVSKQYDDSLSENPDSYQKQVILPNVLRVLAPARGDKILDLACGNGFFSGEFAAAGAEVLGVDISPELIGIAEKKHGSGVRFIVSSAEKLSLPEINSESSSNKFNKAVIILAIQNIEDVKKTLENCFNVLAPKGKLIIVMNHPAFRIPKASSWGFDEKENKQYRRVDTYLSESKEKIDMAPGKTDLKTAKDFTISFHRPLQYYFKLFHNTGFVVTRLEEWISHKESDPGPRQKEENRIRKEIPMFLSLELSR